MSDPDKIRKGTTQEKILRAATGEFAEYGLAGARVDRIAQNAGVNKAMIYYHFASKELLYEKVVLEYISATLSQLSDRVTAAENLESALAGAAETYQRALIGSPEFLRIVVRELANPEGKMIKTLADLLSKSGVPDALKNVLTQSALRDELRDIDINQTVVSFVTLNLGYFLLAPLFNRFLNIEDKDKFASERRLAVVDLFLKGVKK